MACRMSSKDMGSAAEPRRRSTSRCSVRRSSSPPLCSLHVKLGVRFENLHVSVRQISSLIIPGAMQCAQVQQPAVVLPTMYVTWMPFKMPRVQRRASCAGPAARLAFPVRLISVFSQLISRFGIVVSHQVELRTDVVQGLQCVPIRPQPKDHHI